MPLELIGELGISLGLLLYSRWRGGNDRQRAFSEMLTAAPPEAQRAALEIIAVAVLYDGKVSRGDRSMLEAREKDTSAPLVEEAVAVATSALPFADDAALKAFVAQRSGQLGETLLKEHVFAVVHEALVDSSNQWAPTTPHLFASALGLSTERTVQIQTAIQMGNPF
jgi:hypothetical protein